MEPMRIESVNVGRAETIAHERREITTGIRKRPSSGPVVIGPTAVAEDVVVDTQYHGGADQAVYAYSSDDYDWWSDQLGRSVEPGTFGENLTIRGLPSDMNVGDRLLFGEVLLEATAPRIPCNTLAVQMQDKGFGMRFRKAERPGIYLRVLNAGTVAPGDSVTYVVNPAPAASIVDLFRLAYDLNPEPDRLRRYLEAPLAERVRADIERRLARETG